MRSFDRVATHRAAVDTAVKEALELHQQRFLEEIRGVKASLQELRRYL